MDIPENENIVCPEVILNPIDPIDDDDDDDEDESDIIWRIIREYHDKYKHISLYMSDDESCSSDDIAVNDIRDIPDMEPNIDLIDLDPEPDHEPSESGMDAAGALPAANNMPAPKEAAIVMPAPMEAAMSIDQPRANDVNQLHGPVGSAHLENIRAQVMNLITLSEGGIFARELFKKYRRHHGVPLRYNNIDYFKKPVDMILDMMLKVQITRPLGDAGDFLLMVAPEGAKGPLDLSNLDPDSFCPPGCLNLGDLIPPISRNAYKAGQLLLATMGLINSPTDFIILKYGAHNHVPLERMSKEMLSLYESIDGLLLAVPPGAIQVGLYCSAVYAGVWHRARIIEIIDDEYVKIRHVDYGTEDTVLTQNIKPLLRKWATLPTQAIRARLDGIMPPAGAGNVWPQESTTAFENLVVNKALFVHVMSVDEQAVPIAVVAMIDTSSTEDRWIEVELVKEGLADELRAGAQRVHRRLA